MKKSGGASLEIYSQNVSCDIHSEKLANLEGMGPDFTFESRSNKIVETICKLQPDVVALNEIRYAKFVKHICEKLNEGGYSTKNFPNNDSEMAFNNILAVKTNSKWDVVKWCHKWVALDIDNKPCLQDSVTKIEGDPHGRGAGVVFLKHLDSGATVCVLVSHVVPFGQVKIQQQNALLSMNKENLNCTPPVPTIIVGDLNRFSEEAEKFAAQLKEYSLKEALPEKLVIPSSPKDLIFSGENIGTFSPWPTDEKVYERLLREPINTSFLDVHSYTDCESLVKNTKIITHASMIKSPNREPPPEGINAVRHMLNKRMASDHIAILGTYEVYGATVNT